MARHNFLISWLGLKADQFCHWWKKTKLTLDQLLFHCEHKLGLNSPGFCRVRNLEPRNCYGLMILFFWSLLCLCNMKVMGIGAHFFCVCVKTSIPYFFPVILLGQIKSIPIKFPEEKRLKILHTHTHKKESFPNWYIRTRFCLLTKKLVSAMSAG